MSIQFSTICILAIIRISKNLGPGWLYHINIRYNIVWYNRLDPKSATLQYEVLFPFYIKGSYNKSDMADPNELQFTGKLQLSLLVVKPFILIVQLISLERETA